MTITQLVAYLQKLCLDMKTALVSNVVKLHVHCVQLLRVWGHFSKTNFGFTILRSL